MKITEKQKLIIAIVMFSLSAFVIYKAFFSSPSVKSVDTVSNEIGGVVSDDPNFLPPEEGQDILDLANKLDTMSLDSKIFDSLVFTSLVDFKLPITEEPKGRPNPFAPIGNDSGNITSDINISDLVKVKIPPTIKTSEI